MASTWNIPSRIQYGTAELIDEALLALVQREGRIEHDHGWATSILAEDLDVPVTTASRIMKIAAAAGLVTREGKATAVYSYQITPEGRAAEGQPERIVAYVNRRLKQGPSPLPAANPTPTPTSTPTVAAAAGVDVDALAASLLEQVIHRANTANSTAPVVNQHQLAEKDRTIATLRRELAEAQQEIQRGKAALATVNAELVAARELVARSKAGNGARIVDRISKETRSDLVKLMKMAPTG